MSANAAAQSLQLTAGHAVKRSYCQLMMTLSIQFPDQGLRAEMNTGYTHLQLFLGYFSTINPMSHHGFNGATYLLINHVIIYILHKYTPTTVKKSARKALHLIIIVPNLLKGGGNLLQKV